VVPFLATEICSGEVPATVSSLFSSDFPAPLSRYTLLAWFLTLLASSKTGGSSPSN